MPDDAASSLDAVDLPIVLISRDCKIARINRSASTVLGLTAADVGSSIGNALARVSDLDRICARVIADGAPHRIESRDGDRCFLVRIAPCSGNDRQISGAALAFTNVTAFRASIDQAIYEREYTKAILNAVIDPLVVLDTKLRVQTANRAFYHLFGLSRNETHGVSVRTLGNSDWQTSEAWESIEATLSGGAQSHAVEIDCEFPSIGNRTMVLNACRLTRDGNDLLLLTLHDVTERKQAERTTSLLAAIVGFSDDAIISKRLDGTITSWNKSAQRLFGYTAEEAIGQHITLIIPPDRREEETTIMEKLRRGERIDHFETIRMRKDGTLLDVSLTISPLKDSTGRVVGASKVAHDITAHNEAEKNREQIQISSRLLQVQDAERRRIARELHDGIGQLLAAINMNISKGLREEINLSPAGIHHFGEASNLIEQAAAEIRTVSYLLHPPLLDEMGLQSALRMYIDGFAERSKIAAKLEVPVEFDRLPHEHELCLFRIAQECLTNIHRHSESPTAVVRLLRDAESIEMEVIDEGRGIDQKDLATGTSGGSTGVGLRGMRERVKQFGGNLEIRSRGRGTSIRGTSIVVRLPLTDEVLSTANNKTNDSKTELPATRTQTA